MNRIKRFYEEHKEQIVITAAVVAGVALITTRKRGKIDVDYVDLWHNRKGDQLIGVRLTNGTERNFIQTNQEAA